MCCFSLLQGVLYIIEVKQILGVLCGGRGQEEQCLVEGLHLSIPLRPTIRTKPFARLL